MQGDAVLDGKAEPLDFTYTAMLSCSGPRFSFSIATLIRGKVTIPTVVPYIPRIWNQLGNTSFCHSHPHHRHDYSHGIVKTRTHLIFKAPFILRFMWCSPSDSVKQFNRWQCFMELPGKIGVETHLLSLPINTCLQAIRKTISHMITHLRMMSFTFQPELPSWRAVSIIS